MIVFDTTGEASDSPRENVAAPVPPPPARRTRELTPYEFYDLTEVRVQGVAQAIVLNGRNGAPNDHQWCLKEGVDFAEFARRMAVGRKPAYHTLAAYDPANVERFKGRTVANSRWHRCFVLDIEALLEKGGYPGGEAALRAVVEFVKASGLRPNIFVFTGSGGIHLYFILNEAITTDVWLAFARALVAFVAKHDLKIDAQCTTDPARFFRAVGSIHDKTGVATTACEVRPEPYALEELAKVIGFDPAQPKPTESALGTRSGAGVGINADVLGDRPRYSYQLAARRCGALRLAAQDHGTGTQYPAWFLAVRTADLSREGREYAHEISRGHPDYDEAATERKIESLTGGPAGCDAWAAAYGTGGPCESCEYRGQIKNPAVQLGAVVDTTLPGHAPTGEDSADDVPQWLAEMNRRYALCRVGSSATVIDFQTPTQAGGGLTYGFGMLDRSALGAIFAGRYAPIERPGAKPRPLASGWLDHPMRRQYEGLVFAPPPAAPLPASVLNLWQGFAVNPAPGDVTLWLKVLEALVPNEEEQRYVLRWIAWKVQNPGGVPDTVLIFQGAKGTGKNSLWDPLLALFGRHAMLAADPELIAGRFTWHLMTLCLAVLDEAVFIGDPRQADRIKARVTAKSMLYEQKGMDPVSGVNRCAYVMLTNHDHVWQATADERRAVVVEVGEGLRGNLTFWNQYHAWVAGGGPAALLHYLKQVDTAGFNPRAIPKGDALRRQIELTALRDPAAAWWHQCLTEGQIRWRDATGDRVTALNDDSDTEVDRTALRLSYEQSAGARGRLAGDWSAVSKRVRTWAGEEGLRSVRVRTGASRAYRESLAALPLLRAAFSAATGVGITD